MRPVVQCGALAQHWGTGAAHAALSTQCGKRPMGPVAAPPMPRLGTCMFKFALKHASNCRAIACHPMHGPYGSQPRIKDPKDQTPQQNPRKPNKTLRTHLQNPSPSGMHASGAHTSGTSCRFKGSSSSRRPLARAARAAAAKPMAAQQHFKLEEHPDAKLALVQVCFRWAWSDGVRVILIRARTTRFARTLRKRRECLRAPTPPPAARVSAGCEYSQP